MTFDITELRDRTVWQLYRMKDRIQIDPEYQRLGNIWAPDNRQLLIDTILNKFDIPKIYLHKFPQPKKIGSKTYDFAIVDGKQRLETLWSFIDGRLALAGDFEMYRDKSVEAAGMGYREFGAAYPDYKADFDGFALSVIVIETDDLEMIEEMFSRLNEAAPLTAPEKRNAYGGPIPGAIRKIAKEAFFTAKVPFANNRYRHYDLATKFLLAESEGKVIDTKKARLDEFVSRYSEQPRNRAPSFAKKVHENLGRMANVFADNDPLLRQVGMVTLYYHLFRIAHDDDWTDEITRKALLAFDKRRAENRQYMELGEQDEVNLDLIEFDRLAQSPNDGTAIKFRLKTLIGEAFNYEISTDDI